MIETRDGSDDNPDGNEVGPICGILGELRVYGAAAGHVMRLLIKISAGFFSFFSLLLHFHNSKNIFLDVCSTQPTNYQVSQLCDNCLPNMMIFFLRILQF